jgi:hypothetical protein
MKASLIAIFLLFVSVPAQAQIEVTAEGAARIEPDRVISKDLAVLRAKQKALEILGIGIKSDSIVAQGRLLDEYIMVQTAGFVERYEIMDERESGGYLRVRIRAWVKSGKPLEEAYRSVFADRILSISGSGAGSEKIENQLRGKLAGQFYYLLAKGYQSPSPDYGILIESSVTPSSDFHGIKSFYANASISMIQVSAGREVIHDAPPASITIFGRDFDNALNGASINQFPRKVAEPLVSFFCQKLDELAKRRSRSVKITITGLPSPQAFHEFRDYVRNIRLGMEELTSERYGDGTGRLNVIYNEKDLYLATIIGYRREYRIVSHRWDDIRVAYAAGGK